MNFSVISREIGGEACLLLVDDGTHWRLPAHDHPGPVGANAAMAGRYGLATTTLDILRVARSGAAERLFIHELHNASASLPNGARWVTAADLSERGPVKEDQRRMVEQWARWRAEQARPSSHAGGSEGWLPWRTPGWFVETVAWAVARAGELDVELVGPPEQADFRAWSYHLRMPTRQGVVHLKASAPPHGHEPALTRLLAQWFPGQVPTVLACDTHRRLMLTADFGPVIQPQGEARITAAFRAVAGDIARIQRSASAGTPRIAATGCPHHRLEQLPEFFTRLVEEAAAEGELTRDDQAALRRLRPGLARDCARLASFGIPQSVVHHDLWRGNFRADGDKVLVFDWADSVLTHPFLQLGVLLADLDGALGSGADPGAVISSYTAAWHGYGSPAELREAASLAIALSPVSRALLMRERLTGAPPHMRNTYRGSVTAPLRSCLTPAPSSAGRSCS
ncbi:phosphotransferase [Streptomyces sp. A5-4]|uniref:phosphotransferase n=1 Tax=Streptomyces sp. A5-4 TaxID=3384771 RepID=UPI003DA97B84